MSSSLNELGFDGLKNVPGDGRTFPLTTERQERMRERLDAGATEEDDVCTLRGNDVRLILQNEFGVVRSRSAVYDFLHRLGYSHLRPRPRHRKSDPRAQADFQKQLPQRLAEIAETPPNRRLRMYFEDEARFGQQGTTTECGLEKARCRLPCVRRNTNICGFSARSTPRRGMAKACSARV